MVQSNPTPASGSGDKVEDAKVEQVEQKDAAPAAGSGEKVLSAKERLAAKRAAKKAAAGGDKKDAAEDGAEDDAKKDDAAPTTAKKDQEIATFESVNAGASLTYPMQCSALRKNGHVVIKGRPCKIVDMSTSKTGKHGHAKVNIVAIDIFTQKKYEDVSPSTHNMDVPNVNRKEYQLLDINEDDKFMSLLLDGKQKDDVKLPEGAIGDKIEELFNGPGDGDVYVTILSAMGEEAAIEAKKVVGGKDQS